MCIFSKRSAGSYRAFVPLLTLAFFLASHPYIDYLLTEFKVCTGKYLPAVRTDQATKERGLCEKTRRQILSRTDRTNEVNEEFIIWLLAPFFIAFNEALCS